MRGLDALLGGNGRSLQVVREWLPGYLFKSGDKGLEHQRRAVANAFKFLPLDFVYFTEENVRTRKTYFLA